MLASDRALGRLAVLPGPTFGHSVAAGFTVHRGSIVAVCQDSTIVPAGSTGTPSPLVAIVGLSPRLQINTGTFPGVGENVGPGPVTPEKGCWALPFDAAPTWANVGAPVYAIDDETVSLTETPEGGTARLQVGTLAGLDVDGTPYVLIP
ncbi:hypothetical protein JUN65_02040 [Gluconacetobacter azotocaptans]|uniref:hypothetical protein n=1 Tax=Gluconacetobacter azotocaptans TaxID=142834 RepID=UPI00195736EC|nr:hypothetical protein [Gluconacetobacter azotocaptans]MBM9400374.1 hypothetical protein [Gluconacetobacter azotocaptans]